MVTLYKILSPAGTACHGGTGTWNLPKGGKPGEWMPHVPCVGLCMRGYHLLDAAHLLEWNLLAIWTAEGRGEHLTDGSKHVYSEARLLRRTAWDDRSARLFAADCAEHVLPIFERAAPHDTRPREAIRIARLYAVGACSDKELDTAGDAAWDAARDAQIANLALWLKAATKEKT